MTGNHSFVCYIRLLLIYNTVTEITETRRDETEKQITALVLVSEIYGLLGLVSVRPRSKNFCSVSACTEQTETSAEHARLVRRPGQKKLREKALAAAHSIQ